MSSTASTLPALDERGESPEFMRISQASALALRLRSGRFARPLHFGAVNLLLAYDPSCWSDCAYCGLARSRPGADAGRSFIRVQWPLVATDELLRRLASHEHELTRLCISMVTHGRAFADTLEISRRISDRVSTPLSLLVAPPGLTERRLVAFRDAGVDMIGIGLDAVTEERFASLRTDVHRGGLRWDGYWRVVEEARAVFGAWKVNCHLLVGLGETDAELVGMFGRLLEREIFSYLFCLHPEPDSRMGAAPKPPLRRWRRLQLAKFLLEERGVDSSALRFDDSGELARIEAPRELVLAAIEDGHAFMTNGCPSSRGEPGCTRPMGSWGPSETPRDFPWKPTAAEIAGARATLGLADFLAPGPTPPRSPKLCAPPAAGRVPPIDQGASA